MDKMEEKMKGTEAENALAQMFVGKMKTYLKCINVDYESSRIEDFWDLQLNVSGCKTLDDSFRDYVAVETLEGDNKYAAEGYGLQDAKKGVIFESFPQVLHLQLKRFEYDFNRDAMVKVNDRYEFPEVWDASPYLSDTADKSEPYIYHLHGVLVHSGDMNAGHYYAYLKPTKDGDFYRFDDDRVTRATKREAMEENFGGDYSVNGQNGGFKMQNPFTRTWSTKRSMSAYMLVYIRESKLDEILPNNDQVQPPQHLRKCGRTRIRTYLLTFFAAQRLAAERAELERRRKEREEAHLYMNVQVATEANFRAHQGFDIASWNVNEEEADTARLMRFLRATTLADFNKQVAAELQLDPQYTRPWVMVNRQNGTVRPDIPLHWPNMTLQEAGDKYATRNNYFRVFMEEAHRDKDGKPVWEPEYADDAPQEQKPIIIFLKHFDVEKQELKGVGHVYMVQSDKVADLAQPILDLMGWQPGTNLKLFEEIKTNFIDVMKPKQTLLQSEIQDGDIVCFQRLYPEDQIQAITQRLPVAYTDATQFYDYLLNRIQVSFMPKPHQEQAVVIPEDSSAFQLYLSRKDNYDAVCLKLADKLSEICNTQIDPSHLRLTTVNASNGKPRTIVKRNPAATLQSIMQGVSSGGYGGGYAYAQSTRPDQLYYEVLDISLVDMEQRKPVKIIWLPEGITKEVSFQITHEQQRTRTDYHTQEQYDILVPRNGQLSDAIPTLQKRAQLPDEVVEQLRLYEVHSGKVYKQIKLDTPASTFNEFMSIYAERVPADEHEMDEPAGDRLIPCYHFEKEPSKHHGVPFLFLMKEGEIFKETKERLSKRTGIKGKNFEKIKFAIIRDGQAYSKPIVLEDEDVMSEKFGNNDHLGLDHPNRQKNTWARYESLNIR